MIDALAGPRVGLRDHLTSRVMMFEFARRRERNGDRSKLTLRRTRPTWQVELLEERTMLSAMGGLAHARAAIAVTTRSAEVPSQTLLASSTPSAEPAESLSLLAFVRNPKTDRPIAGGRVEFFLASPSPRLLGTGKVNARGETTITTDKLTHLGNNTIVADFIPGRAGIAGSESEPLVVAVNPLVASTFRIVSSRYFGHTGEPLTFTVTALDPHGQVVTNYTGTVLVTSPTDSATLLPAHVYVSLNMKPPPPITQGLAKFQNQVYTFSPADQGTHTFEGGVTFFKGGAEVLKVQQQNDDRIRGFATFGIS
jgi:hypothetical protein